MNWKKKLLKKSRLYVIIDRDCLKHKSLLRAALAITGSSVDLIQLRDKMSDKDLILKTALAIKKLTANKKTIFIINDYIDIAKISDSDGLHLGQGDVPISIARKILGKDKIIGISCHNLAQAIEAQNNGADYIGIGPIFPTATKPEYKPIGIKLINKVSKIINIPFFAIGGITQGNLREVISSGGKRVAVSSAICHSTEIKRTVKSFKKLLHKQA